MKRIIGLTTAALMGASMMVAPALAQTGVGGGVTGGVNAETGVTGGVNGGAGVDTDVEAGASGSAGTDTTTGTMTDTETDAGTTAAIGSQATFDSALSAIESNASSTTAIEAMSEVGSVEVIKIGELEGADMSALETAKTEREAEITELQAALEANTAVTTALEAEDVAADDVVATEMGADGGLIVYVE